jgi:hypothetical protein
MGASIRWSRSMPFRRGPRCCRHARGCPASTEQGRRRVPRRDDHEAGALRCLRRPRHALRRRGGGPSEVTAQSDGLARRRSTGRPPRARPGRRLGRRPSGLPQDRCCRRVRFRPPSCPISAAAPRRSGSSGRHQLDRALDRRLVPVGEPAGDAAPVLGQVVDVDAGGGDDPSVPLGALERRSGRGARLQRGCERPAGARQWPRR